MIPLLAHALWALLAIRLLCWRATVSTLTLLKYIAAGAFISFTVAAPLFKAVNPYAEPSAWLSFAWNLLLTFLLLVPVLAALRGKGSVRTLSVADGFLLAYVVGFGYDLMTAIPGLVAKAHTATAFNLLPPGSLTDPSALLDPASAAKVTHFAGHALWLGAIALAFVTARRFLRRPFHVWLIGLAVFLFCALDQPFFWKPAPFAHAWWLATLHGSLTGWIALAALVLVQALESKWAADPQSAKEVIRHWIGNAEAIAERDFNGLSRRASEDRLRRRILVAQAESRRDSSIAFEVRKLEAQAGRVEEENVVVPSLKGIQWRGAWKSFWFWQSLLWLMLLPVLIYPASINYVIFNSVFNYHLSNLNGSVLDTALIAFLFGRYLLSPGNQTQSGAEGLLQFNVERQIFRCSLWLVTLGCLFQSWNLYFPFPSLYAWFANSSSYWPTDWTAATIRTFLLLVGACLGCITYPSMQRWMLAPMPLRRAAVVRNFMTALTASTLLYLTPRGPQYLGALEDFFQAHGRSFYYLSLHLGTNGNKLATWAFTFLMPLYWLPITIAFGLITRYAVRFFSAPDGPSSPGRLNRSAIVATARSLAPALITLSGLQALLRVAFPHAVMAGGCTSADDCICYPAGSDEGLLPLTPWISLPLVPLISGDPIFTEQDDGGEDNRPRKSSADFATDIRDAKQKFEQLQDQLHSSMDGVLNRLGQFNDQYNQLFNQALHNLANYGKTYQKIVPDIQEILDLASDHELGRKIANATDTTLAVIQGAAGVAGVGLGEDLLAAGEAASGKGIAPLVPEAPPPKVPTAPPLPPDGPLPPEWMPKGPMLESPHIFPDSPPGGFEGDPRWYMDPDAPPGKMIIVGHSDANVTISSARVENIPGVTDVNLHGTPDSVGYKLPDGSWASMDAPKLLARMQADGYNMGDPVRLLACSTGDLETTNNIAQQLADLTGARVSAPTEVVTVTQTGGITVNNKGTWQIFSPRVSR